MRNLQQLQYNASMETALTTVKLWLDARPDNNELQELTKCLTDIYFYVNSLELERKGFDSAIDALRAERNQFAKQAQAIQEEEKATSVAEKFSRETSDDINERLNNLL